MSVPSDCSSTLERNVSGRLPIEKATVSDYAEIRKRLKACAKFLDKTFSQRDGRSEPKTGPRAGKLADRAAVLALELEGELHDWPVLSRHNLHPFRLKVKRLRYVLQMAEESDGRFVASLGHVKDVIGEWHDWLELASEAREVIEHSGCKLRHEIDRTLQERFERALSAANGLREVYLKAPAGRIKKQAPHRARPAVISASTLAA